MRKYIHPVALAVFCVALSASGCTFPLFRNSASLPTPSILTTSTLTPPPTLVATDTAVATPIPTTSGSIISATQVSPDDFCADPQPQVLINNFKSALQTSNGTLLASLVSPLHGMDARLYRNQRVVNYDQQQAQLLFDSTDKIDWGAAPSGLETKGSFNDVIVPALLKVFTKDYALDCDQVQVGGATYKATWPYAGINFYSVYFAGTPNGNNLDWRTWLIGMEYVKGQPYLYAIMQFFWEP
ncbi:MAG: hypothetical protein WCA79_04355 [Anaerolineales bacterium]